MKRLLSGTVAALVLASAAGCSTYSVGAASPGGAVGVPPSGSGASSGSVGLQISSGSAIGMIIAAGILGAAWHGSDARPSDRLWHGYDSPAHRPMPPLDETRRVNEQPCTAPIEDAGANLRCR
jgi:hypothetical protein